MKPGFGYRRLGRFFPATFAHPALPGLVRLRDKHDIAGFSEVFLNPHYWRLFEQLQSPPMQVFDFGGNCGYFPVLCEILSHSKFGKNESIYHIFEVVKELTTKIEQTVGDAGFGDRAHVVHGAVGMRGGIAKITSGRRSYLDASVFAGSGNRRDKGSVPYVDLDAYLQESNIDSIDILKVDIEGSEYDLLDQFPDFVRRARLLVIEWHAVPGRQEGGMQKISNLGFEQQGPLLGSGDHWVGIYRLDR